jgi:hypothetical protein
MPADQTCAEEEHNTRSDVVVIEGAVADQLRSTCPPLVEAPMVNYPGDVAEHPLQRCHILHRGPFHKATEVADNEDQIWHHVDQMVEAADELQYRVASSNSASLFQLSLSRSSIDVCIELQSAMLIACKILTT